MLVIFNLVIFTVLKTKAFYNGTYAIHVNFGWGTRN